MPTQPVLALTFALTAALTLAAQAETPTVGTNPAPSGQPATGQAATPSPANTLGIAAVKLEHGWRASRLIGAAVYNEQNERIGSVDDLILTPDDKVVVAIVSVGGFLGIGSKLVAIPYHQLRMDHDKAVLAGATKDALNALPNFTYAGT